MKKKEFLVGNTLKSCLSASFEIPKYDFSIVYNFLDTYVYIHICVENNQISF